VSGRERGLKIDCMTVEKRCFIDLQDITGVEIECSKCRTKILFPAFDSDKLSVQCPNCGVLFFDPKKDDLQAIVDLGNKLNDVANRGLSGIRLHINLPDE